MSQSHDGSYARDRSEPLPSFPQSPSALPGEAPDTPDREAERLDLHEAEEVAEESVDILSVGAIIGFRYQCPSRRRVGRSGMDGSGGDGGE